MEIKAFITYLKLIGHNLLTLIYVFYYQKLANNKIDATGTFFMKNANWPRLKSLLMNRNQIGMRIFSIYHRKRKNNNDWLS